MKDRKIELYATFKGKAWQCDLSNSIVIDFKGEELWFSISEFKIFRTKLKSIDIHQMLFNLSDDFDFANLSHQGGKKTLKLTLCDIVQLRELFDGTQFSLEMISMLHELLGDYQVIAE